MEELVSFDEFVCYTISTSRGKSLTRAVILWSGNQEVRFLTATTVMVFYFEAVMVRDDVF